METDKIRAALDALGYTPRGTTGDDATDKARLLGALSAVIEFVTTAELEHDENVDALLRGYGIAATLEAEFKEQSSPGELRTNLLAQRLSVAALDTTIRARDVAAISNALLLAARTLRAATRPADGLTKKDVRIVEQDLARLCTDLADAVTYL